MITVCRSDERRHGRSARRDLWRTFQRAEGPANGGFGVLAAFDELRLPPGGVGGPRPPGEAEVVTYVYEGALAQSDSTGGSGVLRAGEFQRMATGSGVRHRESNASRTEWAHVFRLSLRPSEVGLECAREQGRFATAQRRNVLCAVASPDGRKGSLRLIQDAVVYSCVLDPGRHIIHELLPGRRTWLHVVRGEVAMRNLVLTGGDGVGLESERSVSLTASESTEILLVDLGGPHPA